MPGVESFERRHRNSEEDHFVLNTRSMPMIEVGIANIKLGVFSVVCRRTTANWDDLKGAVTLAYAVKCAIFGEATEPIRLGSVMANPEDMLAFEIEATLTDESLRNAVALAYAAEIISRSWRTGSAGSALRLPTDIVDRATDYGIEIPNIVKLWGGSAINRFFLSSMDFLQQCVVVENV